MSIDELNADFKFGKKQEKELSLIHISASLHGNKKQTILKVGGGTNGK